MGVHKFKVVSINDSNDIEEILFESYYKGKFNEVREYTDELLMTQGNSLSRIEAYQIAFKKYCES